MAMTGAVQPARSARDKPGDVPTRLIHHVCMNRQAALSTMRGVVGLWYVGQSSTADLVHAACGLLVAGLDGPSLRMLAAVSIHNADEEVPELLESALRDVDLTYHPKGSTPAQEAGVNAMASRVVSGTLSPEK